MEFSDDKTELVQMIKGVYSGAKSGTGADDDDDDF